MFEYVTAQEAANEWNLSVPRAQRLCKEERINSVINVNRIWLIPENTKPP